jgi:hypothetical protein
MNLRPYEGEIRGIQETCAKEVAGIERVPSVWNDDIRTNGRTWVVWIILRYDYFT